MKSMRSPYLLDSDSPKNRPLFGLESRKSGELVAEPMDVNPLIFRFAGGLYENRGRS